MPDPDIQRLAAREAVALDEADEQRDRAEAAEQQLDQAHAAVRAGDWDALWRALGIDPTERLPEMCTPLDTAVEMGGLLAEQEIRARAIRHAIDVILDVNIGDPGQPSRDPQAFGHVVLGLAARFAAYIRDGAPSTVERPRVVCLCGSTRFKDVFEQVAADETLAGRIVLTVNEFGNDGHPEKAHLRPIGAADKARLDELHKRKIDLADEVLVLNVRGYVGDSTRSEIEYALAQGKPIRYLEPSSMEET